MPSGYQNLDPTEPTKTLDPQDILRDATEVMEAQHRLDRQKAQKEWDAKVQARRAGPWTMGPVLQCLLGIGLGMLLSYYLGFCPMCK